MIQVRTRCPSCQRLWKAVLHPDAKQVHCPNCGAVVAAFGDSEPEPAAGRPWLYLALGVVALIIVAGAIAYFAGVFSPRSPREEPPPPLPRFAGKLTPTDPMDSFEHTKGQFFKSHEVTLQGGKTYQIDLKSNHFDTFLRLEDADKHPLLFNDDLHGVRTKPLDSRLVFTPEKTARYLLIVTSFKAPQPQKNTGDYSLQIDEVVKLGELKTFADSLPTKGPRPGAKDWSIDLSGGKPQVIELLSGDFHPRLLLLDAAGHALVDNSGIVPGNTQLARIDFTPTESASYVLRVSSRNAAARGSYTLKVQAYEPAKARDVAN